MYLDDEVPNYSRHQIELTSSDVRLFIGLIAKRVVNSRLNLARLFFLASDPVRSNCPILCL